MICTTIPSRNSISVTVQTYVTLLACLGMIQNVGCSGQLGDGLTKYPAQGQVTINGQPIPDLIVRLTSTDSSSTGSNGRFPVGVTDDEGVFHISTNGERDGAVAGKYCVTIVWPENDGPPLRDRLQGAYATAAKSNLNVTIEPEENVFPPFELKIEPRVLNRQTPSRTNDE